MSAQKIANHARLGRHWIIFLLVFLTAVIASPIFVIYQIVLGAAGLLISYLVYRFTGNGSQRARTSMIVFAAIVAGGIPYIALGAGLAIA